MKLISTGKTKRQIALMFVFAFTLSNILALIGPSAKAAVTVSSPTAGTCFQHTGSTLNGALPTVYSIGTIQISLTAAEIVPGDDAAATDAITVGVAKSTTAGSISTASDVIGNVFSIVPPTGTNFVIVPGFQNTGAGLSNRLAAANATIVNALSNDTSASTESTLGIDVGVITAGTAGVGRVLVALARDGGDDTYPKSATGTNAVTISINGLGIIIPPTGDSTLTGTLQATFDSTPPSGIGLTGGALTAAAAAAIPGLSGTLNICTLTSAAGQLEAVLDSDDGTNDLYDKTAAAANLLAISQIGSAVSITAQDDGTAAGTPKVDLEPVVIRGLAGTGTATRDQVISTAELLVDITGTGTNFTPATSSLDLNNFGNTNTSPITVTFGPKNSSAATVTLNAVDIIIGSANAGATAAGFNAAQTSRHGFLGALRAASLDSGDATTISDFLGGTLWGIASVRGDTAAIQETNQALVSGTGVRNLATITGNAAEPFTNTFLDLRINCDGTAPVAGWFAIANSSATALPFGTTTATDQLVKASASGTKFNVSSLGQFYTQALTNIAGTTFATSFGSPFKGGGKGAALDNVLQANNALLYASCSGMTVTIIPIQNGFDATKDVIAVVPKFTITNVTSAFTSDIELIATVTGNNLPSSTELSLTKILGAITSSGGATSTLAAATGVGLSETGQLGINCTSGGISALNLSSVSGVTLDSQVTAACTSGSIATPPALFVGGTGNSISGSTVVDGSPVVQGEGRGVLIKELTATGFSELAAKVGGGTTGTVIEVQLPAGCDVIDDRDDNNTATSVTAATGGNDVSMVSITSSAGITVSGIGADAAVAVGTSPANITDSNTIVPASGSDPALVHFSFTKATGSSSATEFDSTTTDGILVKFDAQDIFCPSTITGNLTGLIRAQNKTATPTITENLGTVSFGTATKAADFSVASHTATSTKGETSTNSNLGATVRLAGGSTTTSHPFQIVELNERSFAIGGRVSARNIDPTSNSSTVITRGQIWVTPSAGSVFATAPGSSDVTFSDTTLQIDGAPYIATSTLDSNAPLGTLVIGIKKGTSGDPTTVKSTVTVNNLILATASTGSADLAASVQFFSQDAGATVNTPGAVAGNSASTPTLFTPYKPGGATAKGSTQLNIAGGVVQVGTGSLALPQVTSRLTTLGGPQVNPFATLVTSAKNADAAKITVAAVAVAASSSGSTTTDNTVTVTGAAGSVDGGSQVTVTSGSSSTYDSVTVFASSDGSFTAKLRGDCASPSTSVTVTVTEKLSGTSTTAVTKTALCNGSTGATADSVAAEIAGADGVATITEVLSFITSKGGLSAVISAGGSTLDGVIKAAKSALGLS